MAEYIEREALIKELQEEIEFDSPIHNEVENDWLTRGLKIALKDVKRFPTADVVPKSEVEELKAIIADHKANEERWQELYADTVDKWEKAYEELEIKLENAKTEVAREIFEEIKICMKNFEDDDDGYLLKKCEFEFFMRELEKIYTEEV